MGKVKILFKKYTNIGASALLLISTLLPALALKNPSVVNAATPTTPTTTLPPGGTVDTGNHKWGINDFQVPNNYTPVGKNTSGAGWLNSSTYNFGTFQPNTGSWLPFNGAVDMTQSITISGTTFAQGGGWSPGLQLGDANGILLTNLASSQLSGGATGGNLGVGNLGPGAYFIGNNYSYKSLFLNSYSTASVIAQGNGGGAKILSHSTDYEATSGGVGNLFSMSWTNPVLNANGSVTGTISYTSRNAGTDYTTSTTITVQKSMSIGFMAATGGNYSEMHVTISGVTAGKGVQPVKVNYLNSVTGEQLAPKGANWPNSIINANVGDKIGVVAPGGAGNGADNYDYFAPAAPVGYSFSSVSQPVTVQNFPSGTTNPNVINVYYTPDKQSGTLSYWYDTGTPGTTAVDSGSASGGSNTNILIGFPGNFPNLGEYTPGNADSSILGTNIFSLSGASDSSITFPNFNIPKGYDISKVYGPDLSTSYPSLSAALEANPTYQPGSSNIFTAMLSPIPQKANFIYQYDDKVPQSAPSLPEPVTQEGVTGGIIATPLLEPIASGYRITSIIGPNGVSYPTLSDALEANKYFTSGLNDFKIIVSASEQKGIVTYNWAADVPGQNGVAGQLQAILPSEISLSGVTGGVIEFDPTIPTGYGIDAVSAPDGKTYTDTTMPGMTALEAAKAANPTFVNGVNDFTISLKALMQNVKLNVVVDQASGPNPPTTPNPYIIDNNVTGAPIDSSSIDKAQNWLNEWIDNNAIGWSIKDYTDPNGLSYTNSDLASAISGSGGVFLSQNNVYKVNLVYEGNITFSSVPTTIIFGQTSNPIVSSDKTYSGILDKPVIVSDTRATSLLTPWTVSVTQVSAIQEMDQIDNNIPLSGGISFMNYLSYDSTILTNDPQVVYSKSEGTIGDTNIIAANTESLFTLKVPVDFQKINTNFKGTLEWTLISAP